MSISHPNSLPPKPPDPIVNMNKATPTTKEGGKSRGNFVPEKSFKETLMTHSPNLSNENTDFLKELDDQPDTQSLDQEMDTIIDQISLSEEDKKSIYLSTLGSFNHH